MILLDVTKEKLDVNSNVPLAAWGMHYVHAWLAVYNHAQMAVGVIRTHR